MQALPLFIDEFVSFFSSKLNIFLPLEVEGSILIIIKWLFNNQKVQKATIQQVITTNNNTKRTLNNSTLVHVPATRSISVA